MADKKVTLQILNPQDTINQINGVTVDQTAQYLADNVTGYALVDNPTGPQDLEFEIPDNVAYYVVNLTQVGTGLPYNLQTFDIIGGHKKSRCSVCPDV